MAHINRKHISLNWLLPFVLLLVSCAQQYCVEGNLSQSLLDGRMAYIKATRGESFATIDSCEVLHGQFRMAGPLDSVILVSLFMGDDNFIPLVLEQGDVSVRIENSSIVIGGTPLNERLFAFLSSRDSLAMLRAELPKRESELFLEGYTQDEIIDELAGQEIQLGRALDKLETQFITNNFDNILGVTFFLQLCNEAYQLYGYPTTTPQIDEIYGLAPASFRQKAEIQTYMKMCESGE